MNTWAGVFPINHPLHMLNPIESFENKYPAKLVKVYVNKSVLDLLKDYFQTKKDHLAEIELLLAEGTEILLKYRLFLSV